MISSDKIAEIRDKIDIVALVGERVTLRRAGTSYVGLCPFHTEKTPSFHVSQAKQFYHCFGCQKSGDAFRFLMELDGRTFVEVAEELARRAGVTVEPDALSEKAGQQRSERLRLLRINELATKWFASQLAQSKEARGYLQQREISPEQQQRFRLGYAPAKWDGLLRALQSAGVPLEWAQKAGLAVVHADGHGYDRFRDRIMFPVCNVSGEVVAFSGRVLPGDSDDKGAKYINSPETVVFRKGDHLYGIHLAKEAIRKTGCAVLVEGNVDVLALHGHGIPQAVAPMGTALTENQIRLLKRLLGPEGKLVLMLDGDRAGREALLKDIWMLHTQNQKDLVALGEHHVETRVVLLPATEDPDTWVRRDPARARQALEQAVPALDHVIEHLVMRLSGNSIAEKASIVSKAMPLLRSVQNPAALDLYVMKLSSSLGLERGWLYAQIRATSSSEHIAPLAVSTRPRGKVAAWADPIARDLVALLGEHMVLLPRVPEDVLDRMQHPEVADVLREAKHQYSVRGELQPMDLIEMSPVEMRSAVASAIFSGTFKTVEDPQRALAGICRSVRARFFRKELDEIKEKMALAYRQKNQAQIIELSSRMRELVQLSANFLDTDPQNPV